MELTPTQLANLQAISFTSSKARMEPLNVGQQLVAKVIAVNSNGEVTLNINNSILNAKTSLVLKEGQLLQIISIDGAACCICCFLDILQLCFKFFNSLYCSIKVLIL